MLDRFLKFDKLIGATLIKILYYLGLVGIGLGMIVSIFGAFGMMRYNFAGGLGMIIMSIVGAAIGLLFWRFICEIYMLFFRISEDVRVLRDKS